MLSLSHHRATAHRMTAPELRAAALESKAWPYEEARKLLKRYPEGKQGAPVLFETGYISNADDAEFLASDQGRKKVAESVRKAVEIHFATRLAAR